MSDATDDGALVCLEPGPLPIYWFHFRCGGSRDCLPDDLPFTFPAGWCSAINWMGNDPLRYVEVFEPHNARRMFIVRAKHVTAARKQKCAGAGEDLTSIGYGRAAPDNKFTINVPGLSDVLRVPGIDTAATRRERFFRWKNSNSSLPEGLQPLVKILTKLDDAQDMLFTGLALAWPLLRRLGPRVIPGLGWLLTINDLLNGAT